VSKIVRHSLRLAILISGRGSNMAAIARNCLENLIPADVSVVISDRPNVAGITTAQGLGIEAHVVSWKAAPERAAFELELGQRIDASRAELVVLAGFMRVLSGAFVDRYAGRMINIHPSLLPKYTGLHTHRRALEAGDTVHGATVHFVTPELDGGPAILQSRVPVKPGDTEASLAARVMATEHVIYPRVIGWMAESRLDWNNGHPTLDGEPLRAPIVEDMGGRQ
jgi:phosphoribosylglycinamide formyltransferase-1